MDDKYLSLIHAYVKDVKDGMVRADVRIHDGDVQDVVVTVSHRYSLKTLPNSKLNSPRLKHGKEDERGAVQG